MSRFAQLLLVATFMVGVLDARRINPRCTIQVPVSLRSSDIEELEVKLMLEDGSSDVAFFHPREQGTWIIDANVYSVNDIRGVQITPLSGEPSKFEASVVIDSVTIFCSLISDPLSTRGPLNFYCPKQNPVKIGLDEAIHFSAC